MSLRINTDQIFSDAFNVVPLRRKVSLPNTKFCKRVLLINVVLLDLLRLKVQGSGVGFII